ncbi:MAG TPA: hypothetical protein VEJ16_02435 [Alphaproteobacteria bacterium]|nr:hypothetical protein [Alphaproteobacteria bacterium]
MKLKADPDDEATNLYGSLRSMKELRLQIFRDAELLRAGKITSGEAKARFMAGEKLLEEVRKYLGLHA